MRLRTACYADQTRCWPASGRHILAQFDAETIVVYQAYRPEIGRYAIEHGKFGGEFSFSRMSWVKPNFLWMMYRSDWGRSSGQEVVLALRLRRTFFDRLLHEAVWSTFQPAASVTQQEWQAAIKSSDVRLQWDPDHLPTGQPCERRAIQIGIRGEMLKAYGQRELLDVTDMTEFVTAQRELAATWRDERLQTPVEEVYLPANLETARRVGLDVTGPETT